MRISVFDSRELLAVLAATRTLDREARKIIRRETKTVVQKAWQEGLERRASTRLERRVLVKTARAQASDQNVTLRSAASTRRLSGGLQPSTQWVGAELGSDDDPQFKFRNKKGYVVFPTVAEVIPRLAALWVQTWVRTAHEAFEGRSTGG